MSGFEWTQKKSDAALRLAEGETQRQVSEACGINIRTIQRWVEDPEFSLEVDKLTYMTGISLRAERLKIVKRVLKDKLAAEKIETTKDILDWLKFAQSETDGIKLNLAAALEETTD